MAQVLDPGRYYGTLLRALDHGAFSLQITRYVGDERVPLHAHKLPYVCFVLQGAYRERIGIADRSCEAGTVVVHAGGAPHSDRFDAEGGVCLNVSWNGDGGAALLRRSGRALPEGTWRTPRLRQVGVDLAEAALSRRAPREAAVERRMGDLAEEVARECARAPRDDAAGWLDRVEAAIQAGVDVPPSVRELARLARVHRTTLLRGFWRRHGCSVRRAIGRCRLDRAIDALLHTRDPLARIAQRCGFADQSHLCRSLRAAMGTTPARARAAMDGGAASCVQEPSDETA